MTFHAIGLNHEHASVEQADAFALSAEAQASMYESLLLSDDGEVVVLSTCNRTEAYLYGTDTDVQRVVKALERTVDAPWPAEDAFRYRDEAAVRHVLQVTAGLRSMILGDSQILAQVKTAYQRAVDAHQVHSLLHRLMHTAFRAAKRVSTETTLMEGAASISTAAVEMARQHLRNRPASVSLDDASVLLVGAGKMGRLALNALPGPAPGALFVTNRSPDRARAVADTFDAEVVDWDERHAQLRTADLVVVATGAPHPIVQTDALPGARPSTDTLLVDIARPRNVEPGVGEVPGYEVCDLDDLNTWTDTVQARRASSVPEAEAICEELLSDFVTWVFHQQALQPAIQAIRETFDAIREQEVERHAHRTDMDRSEVEQLTKSIMQKLLAVPIVRLKNVDPDSIDFVQGIKLLHALFAPSEEEGRTLQEAGREAQPSLSEAPSDCPYLTHDPGEAEDKGEAIDEALRMTEEAKASPSGTG